MSATFRLALRDARNVRFKRPVFVTPRSIDRCVTTLRAKVEPDPRKPAYIHTLRDIGYRFEPGGP